MSTQKAPQADRHAYPVISVRLRGLTERVEQHLARTGQNRHAFILKAIEEKLDREAPAG